MKECMNKVTANVLDSKALNRAMLARQMLLSRVKLPVLDAIERLVGLQAQAPNAPYFALWTRVESFRQHQLSDLIQERKAVRMALMRSTLHLTSASDAMQLRPWLQDVMERSLNGTYGKQLKGVDIAQLAQAGRKLIEEEPLTFKELGLRLRESWPDLHPEVISGVVRNLVPLVQTPPRGIWGKSGLAKHTSAEFWLGQALSSQPNADIMVKRYLAAFGPATVKDIQAWSGLSRITDVVEAIRPELVTFRDVQGSELFDLPDAPRPDKDTPSEPRFLGEFDNTLLSYANRNRIIEDKYRTRVFTVNGIIRAAILIDGFVAGTWKLKHEHGKTSLCIDCFEMLPQQVVDALQDEGTRLLHFAAPEAAAKEVVIQSC